MKYTTIIKTKRHMYNIKNDEDLESTKEIIGSICQLEEAAFTILLNNPGIRKKEFLLKLINDHKNLIVEAYGIVPDDIVPSLLKLWDTPYYDLDTGYEHAFKEWAEEFSTEKKVDYYYLRKGVIK